MDLCMQCRCWLFFTYPFWAKFLLRPWLFCNKSCPSGDTWSLKISWKLPKSFSVFTKFLLEIVGAISVEKILQISTEAMILIMDLALLWFLSAPLGCVHHVLSLHKYLKGAASHYLTKLNVHFRSQSHLDTSQPVSILDGLISANVCPGWPRLSQFPSRENNPYALRRVHYSSRAGLPRSSVYCSSSPCDRGLRVELLLCMRDPLLILFSWVGAWDSVASEPPPALSSSLDSGGLEPGSLDIDSISAVQWIFQVEQLHVLSAVPAIPFTLPGKSVSLAEAGEGISYSLFMIPPSSVRNSKYMNKVDVQFPYILVWKLHTQACEIVAGTKRKLCKKFQVDICKTKKKI